jgi:hypothetical protein
MKIYIYLFAMIQVSAKSHVFGDGLNVLLTEAAAIKSLSSIQREMIAMKATGWQEHTSSSARMREQYTRQQT